MSQLFLNHFARLERVGPQPAAGRQAGAGARPVDRVGAQDLPRAGRLPGGRPPVRAGAGRDRRRPPARRPAAGARARARREARGAGRGRAAAGGGRAPAPARREGAGAAGRGLRQPELDRRRRRRPRRGHLLPGGAPPARGRRHRKRHRRRCGKRAGGRARTRRSVRAARARLLRRATDSRNWIATTASACTAAADRDRADRLPLQAGAAGRRRAGRPGRGAAGLQRDLAAASRRAGRRRRSWSSSTSAGQEYAKLAELRERQLGAIADPPARARTMLELATLYRDRLGDRDQAAVYLHAVLEIEPENQIALAAYADHFREKGDWAALADLLEFSFERARVGGRSRRRAAAAAGGDRDGLREAASATPSARIAAWQRAEEIAPTYKRAREAQRRLLLKAKSWDRLAALLEREAAAQTDPGQRAEMLRRVAQLHREKLGNAARAIEIYQEILRADPQDAVSMRAVVETYEREGDFKSLAQLLREQIDRRDVQAGARRLAPPRAGDLRRAHRRPAPRAVGGQRDPAGGPRRSRHADAAGADPRTRRTCRWSWCACWTSTPNTPPTPTRSCRSSSASPSILRGPLQDPAGAALRLEEVVRLDPDDGKALDTLVEIYSGWGSFQDLARILDLQVERVVADSARSRPSTCASSPGWSRARCATCRARASHGRSCSSCCRPTPRRWRRWRASATAKRTGATLVRDPRAPDPAGRGAGARRRAGPVRARRCSTRSCTTPTRRPRRWSG